MEVSLPVLAGMLLIIGGVALANGRFGPAEALRHGVTRAPRPQVA
ncbi:MAG: hypothetical protein ACRDHD_01295 [Candidatus Limnocylindria bacterium]